MPFAEIADRVWVARYPWFDVNVTAVGGARGLLVVDTYASAAAAREVVADVRALGAGDVVAVANTHEHFDHTFGNGAFREEFGEGLPIHATEHAAAHTRSAAERTWRQYASEVDDGHRDEVLATDVVPADQVFSSARVVDLGDRFVELLHPGRGHTAGDLVARVPDVDIVIAGDLVEESGPPAYGDDSFPLDWPLTLDLVLGLTATDTVIVPGHGRVVDRAFVQEQRADIGIVAETIRDLAGRGIPVADALEEAQWPFPAPALSEAVRRGYEHLPRAQRRLPLI